MSSVLVGVRPASQLDSVSAQRSEQPGQLSDRVLPVAGELRALLPHGGLRRGSTISVAGSRSLLLTLVAAATSGGSWAAVVGMPDLGMLAAAELGVAVPRLALIPEPGGQVANVLAALLDGLDVVAVHTACLSTVDSAMARRLSARARNRGAVLVAFGTWPGADVWLQCTTVRWSGLQAGAGHLREREVVLTAGGRGAASRTVRHRVLLPGPTGCIAPAPVTAPAAGAGRVLAEVG